jgi:two-component system, NarL family, sensor histidine kinase DevS
MPDAALHEDRLRRLIEVGRALVAERDLETLLGRILEVAQELTGARYAALGILDESRRGLERFVTRGVDDATRAAIGDLPRGRGILGELIVHPVPLRLHDVGEHPRSYGFPPDHPEMTTFLGVPVLIRGEAYGNLYLTEKEGGGDFTAEDEESIVVLADWASIAIDNARLYQALRGRQDELERAVAGLETSTAIARAVGGETDPDRVLELIVKRARALVEARVLVILLEDHGQLVVAATAGDLERDLVGTRIEPEQTVAGHVLRHGKAERLTEARAQLRATLANIVGADTALFVPLVYRGRTSGVLVAFDRLAGGPEFRAEDEHLLLSFAVSAATAVATAKSVEEDRLRHSIESAEQERRRWARELHDETLQGLGALRVLLSSALQKPAREELEDSVRMTIGHISTEIENLRNLITELRPAALDELGLEPAIQSLVQRTATVQGVDVQSRVQLASGARLDPELESSIYRLVQEALTNVARHARADTVQVSIVQRNGTVDVRVRDDGEGFRPEEPASGFGLAGMRERVALAGGELEIDSAPGRGTAVRARFPVASGEGPGARAAG